MKVKAHNRPDGSIPIETWLNHIDSQAATEAIVATLILEQGDFSCVTWFNGIGEFKIQLKATEYRIYLYKDSDNSITLLYGKPEKGKNRRLLWLLNGMKNTKSERKKKIPFTTDFEAIVVSRIKRDEQVAQNLYNRAITCFLNGDTATSRLLLRDLVNATIGFEQLAKETSKPSKSLHRMLSANGNPTMDNLALIFKIVGEQLETNLEVRAI